MPRRPLITVLLWAVVAIAPLPARAGIPVIDVTAIANLIQQVMYWQQQISQMQAQLNQLQQTYGAMTGSRGMQDVLPMTYDQRNYLPSSYAELLSVANGNTGSYAGLAAQIQAAMTANAILSQQRMQQMSPEMRQIVEDGRRAAATASVMSQTAYGSTSQRFAALQQLIAMVGAAQDTKAAQDLIARINAEQAMLQNEQTKLQALHRASEGEERQQDQRVVEQVIRSHGEFGRRFVPSPRTAATRPDQAP